MTKEEILQNIKDTLESLFEIDPNDVKLESKIFDDLELDSIDAIDMIVKIQKLINKKIRPEDFKDVRTIQDVVDVVYKLTQS